MMDCPRILFTEWNLGKFPDSMNFQSWKINFKSEVCPGKADLQITMQWINEVEIVKSVDELLKSRPFVGRTDFPDFDTLDAMVASAYKKLFNTQIHFRERVSVGEQRAQKTRPILTRKTNIAFMVYEYFRATGASTGAYGAVQGLTELLTISLQHDDVQDFDTRWDHALLKVSEMPSFAILEGVYKSRLQNSEVARNNGTPNYQQLKTAVKLHIDLLMRNGNFRVRNDVVERRSVTKTQKKRKQSVRGKESERMFSVEGTWTMF